MNPNLSKLLPQFKLNLDLEKYLSDEASYWNDDDDDDYDDGILAEINSSKFLVDI